MVSSVNRASVSKPQPGEAATEWLLRWDQQVLNLGNIAFWGTVLLVLLLAAVGAKAHDTWVQTNTSLVRTGDVVHLDLMLGNHGNDHRDFKLASKIGLDLVQSFEIYGPNGLRHDLKPELIDLGLAPKEGFYSARFVPAKPGRYRLVQTLDRVINHGKPIRAVKTAKAFFGVADSLDKPELTKEPWDAPLGTGLEFVLLSDPVLGTGPGKPIRVQLLHQGKPVADHKVSFIPRGGVLKEGTDPDYEVKTDKDGIASFTTKVGTYHLVVAHKQTSEKSGTFESTAYSATMTLFVSQKCGCCAD